MSLNAYLSKHLPGIASGVIAITAAQVGIRTVQTGLKIVKGATATLKASAVVANEEGIVTVDWGGSIADGAILITVEKIGSASGDAADSAVNVAFVAVGDR